MFEIKEQESPYRIVVKDARRRSEWYIHMDWQTMQNTEHELEERHRLQATEARLMDAYPDLWVSVSGSFADGFHVDVWIRRGTVGAYRDAEAFHSENTLHLDNPFLHPILQRWQAEAKLAKSSEFFLCTGHNQAEACHEGQYFYFAGRYCKQWGDEHPEHRAAAAAERYN